MTARVEDSSDGMGIDLDPVRHDLAEGAERLALQGRPTVLAPEYVPTPHKPKALRPRHDAVYRVALADHDASEARAGRVLKVGI